MRKYLLISVIFLSCTATKSIVNESSISNTVIECKFYENENNLSLLMGIMQSFQADNMRTTINNDLNFQVTSLEIFYEKLSDEAINKIEQRCKELAVVIEFNVRKN